jgi:hypothetical protein
MVRSLVFLAGLAVFLPWASCTGGGGEIREEYEGIFNSGAAGEELIAALEDFEVRRGGCFDSKVDLGIYYLAAGEAGRAGDYLRRAESLLRGGEEPLTEDGKVSALYGALGRLGLIEKKYRDALEYADMAIEADRENRRYYRTLKGHILIALEEYGAALEIFDAAMAAAEEAGADELRAYMYLLAQAERPVDAAAALDRYYRTGDFFPGLGFFGAALYRAAGDMEQSAQAIYLEQEYLSGYGGPGNPRKEGFGLLLRGIPEAVEKLGEAFRETEKEGPDRRFAAEYQFLKGLLTAENDEGGESAGDFGVGEFLRLAELEPYFRLFPSFYWCLWLGARRAYPENYQYFSSILQRIIALDMEGPFAKGAWEELTRLMGY